MEHHEYTYEGRQLCQLCCEMQDHLIKDSQECATLIRRMLGYINVEFTEDVNLLNWLCTNCFVDAKRTDTFLMKVAEAQPKLRRHLQEPSGLLGHTTTVKSENVEHPNLKNLVSDPLNSHNIHLNTESTAAAVMPLYPEFSEGEPDTSYVKTEVMGNDTDAELIYNEYPSSYSNHLSQEITEFFEVRNLGQNSGDDPATDCIKTEDCVLENDADNADAEVEISSNTSDSCEDEEVYTTPGVNPQRTTMQQIILLEKVPNRTIFKEQVFCDCRFNCSSNITVQRQEELFKVYHHATRREQVLIITSSVIAREPTNKHLTKYLPGPKKNNREATYNYRLTDHLGVAHAVCRNFYLQLYQIRPSTLYKRLKGIADNPNAIERRGRAPCKWKTSVNKTKFIETFINSLPSYESRYGCSSTNKSKYLKQGLNMSKIYDEYVNKWKIESSLMQQEEQKPVSRRVFDSIFKKEFNLSFKRRQTDTCKTCGTFHSMLISKTLTENERKKIEEDRQAHYQRVQQSHEEFSKDVEKAKQNSAVVLVYDLQQALETPSLPADISMYKRLLWTYNLCIYDETDGQAYMYVWSENVASCGSQEIGSCILKHLRRTYLFSNVKHIILYTDPRFDPYLNIKITLLINYFLEHSKIDVIEQKFFMSGHSHSSCNRQFAIIERSAKAYQGIETPDKWIEIIKNAKQTELKFIVTKMESKDFFSAAELNIMVSSTDKKDWKYEHITKIQNCRQSNIIQFFDRFAVEKIIPADIMKWTVPPLLFPLGRPITDAKFADLMEVIEFIDPQYRDFYKNLKRDPDIKDYGLASGGSDED